MLAGGLELGLIGFFGFSPANWLFSSWKTVVYDVIGLATIWQLARQPLFN